MRIVKLYSRLRNNIRSKNAQSHFLDKQSMNKLPLKKLGYIGKFKCCALTLKMLYLEYSNIAIFSELMLTT